MSQLIELRTLVVDACNGALSALAEYAPRILAAVVLFVAGLAIAKILEWITRSLLKRLRFDKLIDKVGITRVFDGTGPADVVRWMARFVYFGIVLLFLQAATEVLGIPALSNSLRAAVRYLPNLLTALLILFLGAALAHWISGLVTRATRSLGESYSVTLARLSSGLIYIVAIVMAVEQLQLESAALQTMLLCIIACCTFGLALAFALGSREITRNILAGFYARKIFKSGDQVEISGEKGTLIAILPTQTLIESKNSIRAVPNDVYLQSVVEKKGA
jgi:hypothetical protein